jgi:FK506-binding protein 4/5
LVFEIELFEFDNEVDITKEKNGSIKKLETKPPTGPQIPEYDSVVKVEYSVNDTNGVELSEKRTVSFTMGDETFPAGVQFAISSIRMGGAAKFTIRPSQAYGAEGNADLKIPGNSTTVWHIEVLELESPADPSTLSSAEKLTIANQKKTEGNTLFAQGKFKRALDKYDFAASYTKFVPGEEGKQAEEIRTICRLNAAQCLLKLQLFSDAEKRCTEVLKAEPTNIKGLYRRALALHAQGNLAAASADLKLLVATDSTHQEAVRELSKVSAKIKAQEDKERQLYARMFQ